MLKDGGCTSVPTAFMTIELGEDVVVLEPIIIVPLLSPVAVDVFPMTIDLGADADEDDPIIIDSLLPAFPVH